jgi:hypothetical protein
MSRESHYSLFRDYVKHEDDLVRHRLNWNLNIQGFLFATYGFSIQKMVEIKANLLNSRPPLIVIESDKSWVALRVLVKTLPVVGFGVSLLVLLGVGAAKIAIDKLHDDWEDCENRRYKEESPKLPKMTGAGVRTAHYLGFYAPLMIPVVFMGAWAYIFAFLVG